MTALEENGGDDGNSSVAELEVRVETLEETTADHETRISTAETDITGKQESIPVGCLAPTCPISYRSGTVNSKSFVGKVLLRIKQKFELTVYFKHEILGKL